MLFGQLFTRFLKKWAKNQTCVFLVSAQTPLISGPTRAIEGDTVDLICGASKYNYTDDSLVWYKQTTSGYKEVTSIKEKDFKLRHGTRSRNQKSFTTNMNNELGIQVFDDTPSKFDIGKRLRFQSVEPEDSGVYVCQAEIVTGFFSFNMLTKNQRIKWPHLL